MINTFKSVLVIVAVCAGALAAHAQSPDYSKVLADIKARDTGLLAVSEEDGRFLRLMIASSGAKRALEIGGASGYSASWMGMALRDTGGTLVTIEYDPVRAKELVAHNVVNKRAEMGDFLDAVQTHPSLWTTIVSPSGEGMSISLKR